MITKFRWLSGFRALCVASKTVVLLVVLMLFACSIKLDTDTRNEQIVKTSPIIPTPSSTATQLYPLNSPTTSTGLPTLTVTIKPTELPAGFACDSSKLYQITKSPVSWLQWLPTGNQLFYKLKNGNEYWKFNFEDHTATLLPPEQAISFLVTPEHTFRIPENAKLHEYALSPSGTKIIYAQRQYLTSTSPPDPSGEGPGPQESEYDLFVLETDNEPLIHLGHIDGLLDSFIWLPSEESILIQTNARLPGTASIWLADLNNHQLIPLVLAKQGESEATFEALSPDGNLILYRRSTTLHLKHLIDGTEEEIPVATFRRAYYWFLPMNKLLIVDDFDQPLDFQTAIFYLDTNKLCQTSQQILRIHSVELSPDYNYLAIRWEKTLELYVLPVCNVCDQEQ